jgi:dTDP-4-dehydrorhamnose 3,5-epimerase
MPLGEAPRRAGNFTAHGFAIEGPLLIAARHFVDPRGVFSETYSRRDFAALGIEHDFVQDNRSVSGPAGTLRGLHFQRAPRAQAKLIQVARGRILDVAVDLRRDSPSFGKHVAVELEAGDDRLFYVPIGFAHGFVTREKDTEVLYKVSDVYAPDCEGGIAWDDPALGIEWGVAAEAVLLSDKDRALPRLAALGAVF